MKSTAILVSLLVFGNAFAGQEKAPSEFQQVLEIRSPAIERPALEVRPPAAAASKPGTGHKPGTGASGSGSPGLPLIGNDAASAPQGPAAGASEVAGVTPMAHYSTMQAAAADGVDPLQLRESVNVLTKDELSKVDERSIWQVVVDEWALIQKMNGTELLSWAKSNAAVVGGLLAIVIAIFAMVLSLFKRR